VPRERSGDGDTRRGRQRERMPRGGGSNRDRDRGTRESERENGDASERQRDDSEKEGESGKEKAPSGLRRVWGFELSEEIKSTDEATGAPGSPDGIDPEKGGESEKVTGSVGG